MVDPPSGEKDFRLEVRYEFTWDRQYPSAEIYCVYKTPDGSTLPIGTIVPEGLDKDHEFFARTATLTFFVKPKNGRIEPGVYIAGCATEHDANMIMSGFIIPESPIPTSTPENAGKPSATLPLAPTTTQPSNSMAIKGKIVFDYAKTESSRPGAGGELARVTELCIPEFVIGNGSASGQCEKLHIAAFLTDESITAQVTGLVDSSGAITFSYDVSDIGNPNGVWRISYEGQGMFTSDKHAAGTAMFSYSCNSGADKLIWCWRWNSESFSGTIPWNFIPLP